MEAWDEERNVSAVSSDYCLGVGARTGSVVSEPVDVILAGSVDNITVLQTSIHTMKFNWNDKLGNDGGERARQDACQG